MNTIEIQHRLAGFFKLEAVRPDGTKRLLADWFPNLILNQGLNRIGASSDWLQSCRVGTGNTTPTNTDTNLVAHVAGTTTQSAQTTSATGSPPYYGYSQRTFRFDQGAAAGNLAEVGVGWSNADASNLFSRALILDGDGDPAVVTVQADEFLDVSYELRSYSPDADVDTTVTIGGDSYDITARAANANSSLWAPPAAAGFNTGVAYSGAIGAVTSSPTGSQSSVSGLTTDAYSNDSFQIDSTHTWGLDRGNFVGGIASFYVQFGMGSMQYSVDPPIPKDATMVLAMRFRHSWARKTL
jgi:hypothetical protein